MEAKHIIEALEKLVGSVVPTGNQSEDSIREVNMRVYIEVFRHMHDIIDGVAYECKDSREASIKSIVTLCDDQLNSMNIEQ